MEKSDAKSKKARVLIVEDHPIVSHALQRCSLMINPICPHAAA